MAEEAEEEVVETSALASALESLQASLDATEEPEAVDEVNEQEPGVEESAEADPVEEQATEQVAEVLSEGPSFLMKQAATTAGIPQFLVETAHDDAQLQGWMEMLSQPGEAKEAEPEAPFSLNLPEDEFGADDPVRKQFSALVATLNGKFAEQEKKLREFEETRTEIQRREYQAAHKAVFSPFDEVLDSYDSDVLGKTGSCTPKQIQAREKIAAKYQALGATPGMDATALKRKAILAISDEQPDLVEQHNKKAQAARTQPQRVLGGGGQRSVEKPKGPKEIMAEWDLALAGKKPLALN